MKSLLFLPILAFALATSAFAEDAVVLPAADVVVANDDGVVPAKVVIAPATANLGVNAAGDVVVKDDATIVVEAIKEFTSGFAGGAGGTTVYGVLALIVLLLTRLSRLGWVGHYIKDRGIGWATPLLAVVLGGLGGLFAALQQGQPWFPAMINGVIAGVGATGLYEVLRTTSATERNKTRVDKDVVAAAAPGLEKKVEEAAEREQVAKSTIDAKLAAAAELPEAGRLEALAKLVKSPTSTVPKK